MLQCVLFKTQFLSKSNEYTKGLYQENYSLFRNASKHLTAQLYHDNEEDKYITQACKIFTNLLIQKNSVQRLS